MSFPTLTGDAPNTVFFVDPQVCLGPAFAGGSYQFFTTGTTTPANVYQDGALTTPFPNTGVVSADANGRFPAIYLDTSVVYAVLLTDAQGNQRLTDPYTPSLATVGTSSKVAFGFTVAPTGEIVIPAPNAGGSTISLTLKAGQLGSTPLKISSTLAGQPALIINNSVTTGAQTATFTATNKPGTATSSPAGWLPISCDGTIYYIPIWHGNNFTPYVSNPSAIGEAINATTVTFNGNGSTTATGGTAVPSSWFIPNQTGVGAGYYIKITKTGGLSGLAFSTGSAVTNITSGGLTISNNAAAQITGTYILSTSNTGVPVVANGTITLSGGTGIQQPTINGAAALVLNGDGTATLNGASTSNWFTPTTASTGHLYWINITRTGGTSGVNFSAAQGAFTNITDGGLTINLTGTGQRTATGTYQIASDSGGVNVLGSGTIILSASGVLSPNWSGTTPLKLVGDGTATLNGAATSSWFSPTTPNTGSGYWFSVFRSSGTVGVNFSAAQGVFTNITNSGLTIDLSGTSGNVGTVSATGQWQISNSSSGSPVLGTGVLTLTLSGLSVIHVYTTVVTNATETILTGTTTVTLALWGSGGGGGDGTGGDNGQAGKPGGCGGRAVSTYSVSSLGGVGKTFKYTIGAGGSPASGGANNTITAGTVTGFTAMTGNGGAGTVLRSGGAGGTATGGNVSNTTGATQSTSGLGTAFTGDGAPHGGGGAGGHIGNGSGGTGQIGAAVFRYT